MKTRTKIMAVLGLLVLCSVGTADELLVPSQYPTIQSAIDDTNEGDTVLVADGTYTGAGNRDIDFLGKVIIVYPNIQAAIDDSNDGDTILVADGVYTGEGNRDIDFKGKAITVRSQNGPNNCIIDCNGTEAEPHRGFYFHSGEDANSILDGFTITKGDSRHGDCPFGGAISCMEASPTIASCVITGNLAMMGGGIYNRLSNPIVTNCTFNDNLAGQGGGMVNWGGSLTVTNCTFSGNWVAGSGGGMRNWGGSPTVTNCTFSGNSAEYYGGGMRNYKSNPTITNCTFSGNLATWSGGGGMHNSAGSSPILTNCTLSGNLAEFGGGMYNYDSSPTLTNCILWDNTASFAPQIYNEGGSSVIVSYSNMQGGWLGTGNINADPCFVEPGYWDPNGTPGEPDDDFWVDGDYHLKSEGWSWDRDANQWTWDDVTSRCIDAGNPGSPLGDEPLTLEVDPLNRWGENLRINMGAFGGTAEASMPPYDWAILGDLTNDGLVNLKDYASQAADWRNSAGHQPGDLNRDGLVDISDVALLVEDWLRQTTWHE